MVCNDVKQEKTVWVVGDIHGCYDEFRQLETRIYRSAQKHDIQPLILSLGDLVDRGPDSLKVVEHFCSGEAKGTHMAIAGNHESMMLLNLQASAPWNFDNAGISPPIWLETVREQIERGVRLSRFATEAEMTVYTRLRWVTQGGAETLQSYNCDPRNPKTWNIPPKHLRYLASLPLYWEDDHAVVTHALAGSEEIDKLRHLNNGASSQSNPPELVRNVLWSREKPDSAPGREKIHISGHSVIKRVQHNHNLNIIQIDTGCTYGQRLTTWCPTLQESMSVHSEFCWRTD